MSSVRRNRKQQNYTLPFALRMNAILSQFAIPSVSSRTHRRSFILCVLLVSISVPLTFHFLLTYDYLLSCIPRNPSNELGDWQDDWQYQNSVTGEWYNWSVVRAAETKQAQWQVKWLNTEPKSHLGVIIYLTTMGEFQSLRTSLTQLRRLLQYNPRPVVIFHEGDFDDKTVQTSLAETVGNQIALGFERIKFSNSSKHARPFRRRLRTKRDKYFDMCRFFIIMLPNHPLLTLFTYFWRLDAHSFILAPKPIEDPFDIMLRRRLQYAFIMVNDEDEHYATDLWGLFHQFLKDYCLARSSAFRKTQIDFFGGYSLRIIFTNFAIANASLFRQHPLMQIWLRRVDRHGGIYLHRWGDAPVHTLAVTQFIPRHEVARLRYFGYMHRHEYVCANDIDRHSCKEQVKPFLTGRNVTYKFYQDGCYPSPRNPLCHYYPEIKV